MRNNLEILIRNYERLTPEQRSLVQQRVIEGAKIARAAFLRSLLSRLRSWLLRRAAVADLNALDDEALKDVGLHRSGIEAAVRESLVSKAAYEPFKPRLFPQKPHLCLHRTG